jgi:DNA-binding winged helix-turn-helix (wHTH) protein
MQEVAKSRKATLRRGNAMRVRFDPYILDLESRQLVRGDDLVHLSPKAFDLLTILVSNRPKALSKSDLQERLWPGTFVVEKNLSNLIGEIRAAIGDDPSNPRFIRTVHRFGYAFRDVISHSDSATSARRPGEFSFLLKWTSGRARLGEGAHVLGRDPDVEILLDGTGVSRRHALLTISEGSATIVDLGSKNGTFIGDQRVDGPRSLGDGDIITVGSVKLTLSLLRAPRSTETKPHAGPELKQ